VAEVQLRCRRCGEALTPEAVYCDRCGERTESARRKVRLAVRAELVFLALVTAMILAFAWVQAKG
jgi:uncharacterized OB-fold protein